MKLLFIYPWDGFRPHYLKKDVGLFPEFLSRAHAGTTTMMIKGTDPAASSGRVRLVTTGVASNIVNSFVFFLQALRLSRSHSALLLFHVGGRNVLPALAFRFVRPRDNIIAKLDLDPTTAEYLARLSIRANTIADRVRRVAYRLMFKSCSAILVETTRAAQRLPRRFCGVDLAKKLHVVPNGLDPIETALIPKPMRKANVLTFITRFDASHKGGERIIDLLEALCLPHDWTIRIIGEVPAAAREAMSGACSRNGNFLGHLEFTGHILDRGRFISLLSESNIFANTSKAGESFCISMIEAAACGNTLITTDVGVASDLQQVYRHVVLTTNYSTKWFCDRIEEVMRDGKSPSDDELRSVADHYGWDRIVSKLPISLSRGKRRRPCGRIGS